MIFKSILVKKYNNWIQINEDKITTYANHLIVIFAFSVPLFVSVRRVSISLIILLFLARGRIIHHTVKVLQDPLMASFFVYFLVHLIWMLGSDDLLSAKKSLHDSAFLLFALIFVSFIDKRYVSRIAGAFVFGMVASSIISYGIFFEFLPEMPHDGTQGVVGDPTPLYHHTQYGYMLAITAVLLLYKYIVIPEADFDKTVAGVLFVLIALNMLIIEGRSGFVIFILLALIMIILHYKVNAAMPVLLTIVVVIVTSILSYNYIDVFKERVDLTVKSSESVVQDKNYNTSIGGRVGMQVYSLDAIAGNLAFGHGTGDHVAEVRKLFKKNNIEGSELVKSLQHTHSEYTSSLLQFGILGLLAFLNIPYQMLRYSSGFNGRVLKVTGISILLYSLIEVFIIGSGVMLSVIIIGSLCMNNYFATEAKFKALDVKQVVMYALIITGFYVIKLVLP